MEKVSYQAFIVEDDVAIANLLRIHLTDLGFAVDVFQNAEPALFLVQEKKYQLGLLDWMLPSMQGIELLEKIRALKCNIKILMLTAKADSDSIVKAIEAGADDYLTKPFDEKVLLARVRNLIRRLEFEKNILKAASSSTDNAMVEKNSPDRIEFNDLSMHFTQHTVEHKGQEVHLTPSEFKLLEALFKAQGRVMSREQLISLIQGDDVNVTGRTIDTHVFALRKKLGSWADHIETIRGVGYRVLVSASDPSSSAGEL
ncbi:MAG: hypothetical protein A2622_13190 [Bdellovibrionales bacterium RIFCSPHIGHO2_01_FULL_40_29]|nr:MAG: hypothetical protein A2622_13190 [Bdellovibrionales bacterium RIFCSPHIGHO2_01_FULL_40_29]OFZ33356.1 MAG: hypothetical protein A3D17_13695 [Bdellovibrionales bacterium RIFCSPHIGHO2_02_FULL_40_15]